MPLVIFGDVHHIRTLNRVFFAPAAQPAPRVHSSYHLIGDNSQLKPLYFLAHAKLPKQRIFASKSYQYSEQSLTNHLKVTPHFYDGERRVSQPARAIENHPLRAAQSLTYATTYWQPRHCRTRVTRWRACPFEERVSLECVGRARRACVPQNSFISSLTRSHGNGRRRGLAD